MFCLLRPWPHQTKLPCQRLSSVTVTGNIADLYSEGDSTGRTIDSQKDDMFDAETVYTAVKDSCNNSEVVVYQNIHRVGNSESLFNTPVAMSGAVTFGGMLDSGSMACSISETAEMKLREAGVVTDRRRIDVDVVLIACGGLRVKPKCAFKVEMEVYGCKMLVPTLVIQGQHDELILGTNVIKHILHQSKLCDSYWRTPAQPKTQTSNVSCLCYLV